MSKFSLIIPSYNGERFLKWCLNAIAKSTILPSQIIVIDDCSGDKTEEIIKSESNIKIEYIKNEKNLGVVANRNKGAKLAREEFIIFMDQDVIVRPNTLERMINLIENNPDVGVVGAKFISESGEKVQWNMGYDPNNFREAAGYLCGFFSKLFPKSQWLKNFSTKFILNYWDYNKTLMVDWTVEACFIIRREVFNEVGGFDERFWMYFEGPDLCRRVRQKGFKVYFNHEAIADILEGHVGNKLKRNWHFLKSKYLFYEKHYFYIRSNPLFFFLGRIISGIFYLMA
jgi:hypothetical protein